LAARLRDEQVCEIHPLVPQVNAFQVILRGTVEELKQRNRDFATKQRIWLFNAFFESPFEGKAIAEIVIGDAADDYTDEEASRWLQRFQAASGSRRRPLQRRNVERPPTGPARLRGLRQRGSPAPRP